MREDVREVSVAMAKCRFSQRPYGIRIEKRANGTWYCTWTFTLTEKTGTNEGYGETMILGGVDIVLEYPGCPYCGTTG